MRKTLYLYSLYLTSVSKEEKLPRLNIFDNVFLQMLKWGGKKRKKKERKKMLTKRENTIEIDGSILI